MSLVIAMGFGLLGGLTRATVGLLKHYRLSKKTQFNMKRFVITLLLSGVIGLFAGLVVASNFALPLVAGYAGTDFLEGLYKSVKK